jgi:hypothetical protein
MSSSLKGIACPQDVQIALLKHAIRELRTKDVDSEFDVSLPKDLHL